MQTELAQTIVGQLRGQLTGGAVDPAAKAAIQAQVQAAEKGGTKNVEAHEAYLQGRFFINRHSEKETDQARAAFERAVELDPNSRSRGRGWPRLTSGIATMPPREARKVSTLIWPPRARRWNELSPSNQTCRMRCSPGR